MLKQNTNTDTDSTHYGIKCKSVENSVEHQNSTLMPTKTQNMSKQYTNAYKELKH